MNKYLLVLLLFISFSFALVYRAEHDGIMSGAQFRSDYKWDITIDYTTGNTENKFITQNRNIVVYKGIDYCEPFLQMYYPEGKVPSGTIIGMIYEKEESRGDK
jgi:hypothetical protein